MALEPASGGVTLSANEAPAPLLGEPLVARGERAEAPVLEPLPGRGLDLKVTVVAHFGKGAERFGGLSCEFGVGRGALGWRVAPLDGVVLARGVSDASGELDVHLEIPPEWLDGDEQVVLFGRVMSPGFQQLVRRAQLPEKGRDHRPMMLQARRGVTLRGLVVGPDGEPSPASLSVVTDEDGSTSNYEKAVAGKDGRFEFGFAEPTTCRLLAVAPGVGTAISESLSIEMTDAPQELRLRLSGAGVLAGVLLDLAGEPVPNFDLWAGPEGYPKSWVGYLSGNEERPLLAEGRGNPAVHFVTDEAGRFRLTGLRPGNWIVRAKSQKSGYYERLLTPRPVETGTEDLRLVLERSVLVVQVVNELGESVPVGIEFTPRSQAEVPRLFCRACDEVGRILEPAAYDHVGRKPGQGNEVVFDVEPGQYYIVGLISPSAPLVEELVFIPDDRLSTEQTLRLPAALESGSRRITLEESDGAPFQGTNRVIITTPESGLILFESSRNSSKDAYELELAAGVYRVSADDIPSYGHHGERFGKDRFLAAETLVTVLAGAVADLPMRLGRAGSLEVEVATPSAAPDGNRLIRELALFPLDGGPAIPLRFIHSTVIVTTLWSSVPSGPPQLAVDPIPVGDFVLHGLAEGGEAIRVPVTIRDGKKTRVEL